VVAGAAAWVDRPGVQQGPHDPQGRAQLLVAAAVDQGVAGGGPVKAEDHPHRGGLAGAVGTEEAGHLARLHLERQVVDGQGGAVPLGQPVQLDHVGCSLGVHAGLITAAVGVGS
jgi:hypothetical protein